MVVALATRSLPDVDPEAHAVGEEAQKEEMDN